MNRKLLDDCFLHDKGSLKHADALALLRERLAPIVETEELPLAEASGRILAQSMTAPRNIPAHDNAAVDGYAFAFADYDAASGSWLTEAGRAAAGHGFHGKMDQGQAIRIFTGASMPAEADSVVMQEDVDREIDGSQTRIFVPAGLKAGANRRLAGEDVRQGETIAVPGQRLRPQDIAALAASGAGRLICYKRPRIAVISTGDELIRAGTELIPGQVYDANAPMLSALAHLTGCDVTDLGILPDKADIVREKLIEAASQFDMLISSGGASRGEGDHIVKTVDSLGSLQMWRLAIKPGRPISFGQIGDCIFLGLPGNPVAVFVCFLLYAAPVMRLISGGGWREPRRFLIPAGFDIGSRKTGRREFLRGMIEKNASGEQILNRYAHDGSGLISSLRASDGLIEIPEDVHSISAGDPLSFIPYSEFAIVR